MIHKVEITKEMIEKATARDNGAYNDMSILGGRGNIVGFLGEYIFAEVCPTLTHVDKFDHDFELNDLTIDVKTKRQTVPYEPKGTYEASVTMESLQFQHPDYYIFCRIYTDENKIYRYGWVLGGISYDSLMTNGRYIKQGTVEGKYTFKKDNINIRYDQLQHVGRK